MYTIDDIYALPDGKRAELIDGQIAVHEKDRILVYNFEQNTLLDCTFSDSVKAGIYEDLYIDFSQIGQMW